MVHLTPVCQSSSTFLPESAASLLHVTLPQFDNPHDYLQATLHPGLRGGPLTQKGSAYLMLCYHLAYA